MPKLVEKKFTVVVSLTSVLYTHRQLECALLLFASLRGIIEQVKEKYSCFLVRIGRMSGAGIA
jgi:hypothetical protein